MPRGDGGRPRQLKAYLTVICPTVHGVQSPVWEITNSPSHVNVRDSHRDHAKIVRSGRISKSEYRYIVF